MRTADRGEQVVVLGAQLDLRAPARRHLPADLLAAGLVEELPQLGVCRMCQVHLEAVPIGWREDGNSYWLNNTLTLTLDEPDMVAIATTMNEVK